MHVEERLIVERCVTLTNLRRKLSAFSITLPSPLPRAEIPCFHTSLVLKIANIIEERDYSLCQWKEIVSFLFFFGQIFNSLVVIEM